MDFLVKELRKELEKINAEIKFEIPKEEFGDLAIPCFKISKALNKSLDETIREIKELIEASELVERTERKGGYLNIFLNWEKISKKYLSKIVKENYGIEKVHGKKIMIEHTSVNPNKALHIGHIRNACLGDSLKRLLEFCGEDLVITNYIDDTGAQVADIVVGFKILNFPLDVDEKFDAYCGDVYVKVNEKYKENEELLNERKKILKLIEKGDNETAEFALKLSEKILKAQLQTLWRLGIFYDLLNRESDILKQKLWIKAFEKLKKMKLVYKDELGRIKLKLSLLEEFKGMKDPDITLIRSNGTALYVAKDIAYAMWKHGLVEKDFMYKVFEVQPNKKELWITTSKKTESSRHHPKFNEVDISINVIDVRQSYEQNAVRSALKLIAGKEIPYIHYAYEVVALSKESVKEFGIETDKNIVHMSGRKGIFFNVDDILEKLKERAKKEIEKRNKIIDEKLLNELAEKIATSSLRYEMVKVGKEKMIIFDIEKTLNLEENTASYLLYSFVRANSILKKAGEWKEKFNMEKMNETEKKLVKKLLLFPNVIKKAAKELKINLISSYVFELSQIFNIFYEKCPVIKEDEQIRNFRLTLVYCFSSILEKCFDILGIQKIKKM